MVSVEKEGMKLYDQLEKIQGAESQRLSTLMEDFGKHGSCISVQSLSTLTLGTYIKVFDL